MPKLNQWIINADATNRHAKTANGTRLRIKTARTIFRIFTPGVLNRSTRDSRSASAVMSGQSLRGLVYPAHGVSSQARSLPRWLRDCPGPSRSPYYECEPDGFRSERRVDDQ